MKSQLDDVTTPPKLHFDYLEYWSTLTGGLQSPSDFAPADFPSHNCYILP